ncbi:efflux transporter periplasmic adaptor subunit, partial [Xanthomonas citri pv. citri]
MYADVEIATGDAKPVVAVPDDAVIDTGERQVVLIDRGEGRFEPKAVKVGVHGGGYTEIRDGVSTGDRVVTSANFLIDAESNLKAALQGLAPPRDNRQAADAGATP